MQIRKQDLAGAQLLVFDWLRFLDLDHHLGLDKDFRSGVNQLRASVCILLIAETNRRSCLFFDHDLMAMRHQFAHAGRGQANAVFMIFDFLGSSDQHVIAPFADIFEIHRAIGVTEYLLDAPPQRIIQYMDNFSVKVTNVICKFSGFHYHRHHSTHERAK